MSGLKKISIEGCYQDEYCQEVAGLCNGDPTCVGALYCYEGDRQCYLGWACGNDKTCASIGSACTTAECFKSLCKGNTTCESYVDCNSNWKCSIGVLCGTSQSCIDYSNEVRAVGIASGTVANNDKTHPSLNEFRSKAETSSTVYDSSYPYTSAVVLFGT